LDGSDLGRIKLQQQLVEALLKEVRDTNPLTGAAGLYELADVVTGSLTTDTGLDSLGELRSLAQSLRNIPSNGLRTVTMPVVAAPSDPNRVVAQEPAASKLWASLR
jgi:anionic cell wall polymer biosynthesis LytR-Cps2A-Psr (LCP) family protein